MSLHPIPRRVIISLIGLAVAIGGPTVASPTAHASPPGGPPVVVTATGRVVTYESTPPQSPASAASPSATTIRLDSGTSVPVADPTQAAPLRPGDRVSLRLAVPTNVVAALSAADAAALAARPVTDGVVSVPASSDLGNRLLAATLAAQVAPSIPALTVMDSPASQPLAAPTAMAPPGSPGATVNGAALNQTIDLVIAYPGADSSNGLSDADALRYIAAAQAWYRANTDLGTFTLTVSAIKHLHNDPYVCGGQDSTVAEWDLAAQQFGHPDRNYYADASLVGRHLVVFESYAYCRNAGYAVTYGGLGSSGGTPSLGLSGIVMNRLFAPVDAREYAYSLQDVVHELGHNYGLGHSHLELCTSRSGTPTWNQGDIATCPAASDYSSKSEYVYGDAFEFMGFGYFTNAMGATRKYQTGLLADSAVITISTKVTSQSVTLAAVPTTTNNTTPQLAYILDALPDTPSKDPLRGDVYTVELRKYEDTIDYGFVFRGFSAGYGFVVLRADTTDTWLTQPTATSLPTISGSSRYWGSAATLKAGDTFTSPDGLISMTVSSVPAASCTSNCTGTIAVTRKVPSATIAAVAVTGTAQVGQLLNASASGVVPSGATLTYQWLRNGVPISGATGRSYEVVGDDLGARLSVTVTAAASGHTASSRTSAATASVLKGNLTAAVPKIFGTALVGATLTASAAGWAPTGVALTFQWALNGKAIAGATAVTYVVRPTDRGGTLTVIVTGRLAGYNDASRASAATAPVTEGDPPAPVPTIAGTPEPGSTVVAQVSTGLPAGTKLAFQWLEDDQPMPGATGARYTITGADLWHVIAVRVTETVPSHAPVSGTSAPEMVTPACVSGTPTLPMRQFTLGADMNSDGRGETLAVDSQGLLWMYPGTPTGALGSPCRLGTGFVGVQIYGPGDTNSDGLSDVYAITPDGNLWLFPGEGEGPLGPPVRVGSGWTGWTLVPSGDLNGDGKADILGINVLGDLYMYAGKGNGQFWPRVQVGSGWAGWSLYSAGDLNGDGKADILGINARGDLYEYTGKGTGRFNTRQQAGWGWIGNVLAAGADLNGDGWADIVGCNNQTGILWYYQGTGGAHFAKKVQIATGW